MESTDEIDRALGIDELRAGFLQYTREAYALLPALGQPRVLDIGCGSGLPTIELARLSGGDVVGIDTDAAALTRMRQRVEEAGLSHRVKAVNASLYESGLPGGSFDLLWEEGLLHQLDLSKSLAACHRLLRPSGFLVMHETISWFEGVEPRLGGFGFRLVKARLLPSHCWWTDYYAPLEARVRKLREGRNGDARVAGLARYQREIDMVKTDPGRVDCGFFVARSVPRRT